MANHLSNTYTKSFVSTIRKVGMELVSIPTLFYTEKIPRTP
nr:MAG TPA: hypothetical protein [Bacteriophage sp.]